MPLRFGRAHNGRGRRHGEATGKASGGGGTGPAEKRQERCWVDRETGFVGKQGGGFVRLPATGTEHRGTPFSVGAAAGLGRGGATRLGRRGCPLGGPRCRPNQSRVAVTEDTLDGADGARPGITSRREPARRARWNGHRPCRGVRSRSRSAARSGRSKRSRARRPGSWTARISGSAGARRTARMGVCLDGKSPARPPRVRSPRMDLEVGPVTFRQPLRAPKVRAERLVRRTAGACVQIFRPSIVVGRLVAGWNPGVQRALHAD